MADTVMADTAVDMGTGRSPLRVPMRAHAAAAAAAESPLRLTPALVTGALYEHTALNAYLDAISGAIGTAGAATSDPVHTEALMDVVMMDVSSRYGLGVMPACGDGTLQSAMLPLAVHIDGWVAPLASELPLVCASERSRTYIDTSGAVLRKVCACGRGDTCHHGMGAEARVAPGRAATRAHGGGGGTATDTHSTGCVRGDDCAASGDTAMQDTARLCAGLLATPASVDGMHAHACALPDGSPLAATPFDGCDSNDSVARGVLAALAAVQQQDTIIRCSAIMRVNMETFQVARNVTERLRLQMLMALHATGASSGYHVSCFSTLWMREEQWRLLASANKLNDCMEECGHIWQRRQHALEAAFKAGGMANTELLWTARRAARSAARFMELSGLPSDVLLANLAGADGHHRVPDTIVTRAWRIYSNNDVAAVLHSWTLQMHALLSDAMRYVTAHNNSEAAISTTAKTLARASAPRDSVQMHLGTPMRCTVVEEVPCLPGVLPN